MDVMNFVVLEKHDLDYRNETKTIALFGFYWLSESKGKDQNKLFFD